MKTFLALAAIGLIVILAIGVSEALILRRHKRLSQQEYDNAYQQHLIMTENDHRLIQIAEATPANRYADITDLIKQADTEECRRRLRNILDIKYHQDEYDSNML